LIITTKVKVDNRAQPAASKPQEYNINVILSFKLHSMSVFIPAANIFILQPVSNQKESQKGKSYFVNLKENIITLALPIKKVSSMRLDKVK
jgi:hypothetical protein